MKLQTLKYAALGTVAVGALFSATDAMAQAQTDTGDITAIVDNSFTLTETTSMHFGTVVAVCDTTGTNQATIVLDPGSGAGAITNNAPAQYINVDIATRTRGVYDITGAAPNTPLTITLANSTDLSCTACGGTPSDLLISALTDSAAGTLTTDGAGAGQFGTGATLSTAQTCSQYEDGTYTGTYDVSVSY